MGALSLNRLMGIGSYSNMLILIKIKYKIKFEQNCTVKGEEV